MEHDAINDILYNPRFQGAIESIRGVTEFMDGWFIKFISIIAFFIISAALLRNVVAGAYAAYPKFWDMIADAKEALKGKQISLGGTDVSFLAKIGAFFIPNLKAMSDFNDNTVEPKHYFIVAIPKMVLVVMIGVVIYNGYYRDAVSITAGFGSVILDRFILNTDPASVIDSAFEAMQRPEFASEGDNSTTGKYAEKISEKSYNSITDFYSDIKDIGTKSNLAQSLESAVYTFLNSHAEYMDEDKWSMTYQVDLVLGAPDLTKVGATNGVDPDQFTFATSIDVRGLGFDTKQHANESWFLRIITRFERKVTAVKDTGIYQDLQVTVTRDQTGTAGTEYASIRLQSGSMFDASSNGASAGYKYDKATGTLTFNPYAATSDGVIRLSPSLSYATSDGKIHSVTSIKIVDGTGSFAQTLQSLSRQDVKINVGQDFPKNES